MTFSFCEPARFQGEYRFNGACSRALLAINKEKVAVSEMEGQARTPRGEVSGPERLALAVDGKVRLESFQFSASDRTRPSQPFGGRTFRMNAMVRPRSTTSESPYLPGLIQLGPYIASGTLVSYDHGDPCVEA